MNEEQYQKICKICDQILLAPESNIERVAIPWLHVLREHPVFLKQYDVLFLSPSLLDKYANWIKHFLFSSVRLLKLVFRIKFLRGAIWHGNLPECKSVDFLFVSHLLNVSQLKKNEDFYFGTVPAELERNGKSVIVLLINHTDIVGDDLKQLLHDSPFPKVVIASTLSFKDEFIIWWKTIGEAKNLRNLAKLTACSLHRQILERSAFEVIGNGAKNSLRISRIVGKIVSQCCVKSLVTTYEGHSWERLAFAEARNSNPNIICIGYQHAALFRLQHAAKRSLGKKYDPEQILTTGQVGLRQLQSAPDLSGISKKILGSIRSTKDIIRINSHTCLVVPEGILEECEILFKFSLACAEECPNIHFIWRLHPMMALDKISNSLFSSKKFPSNIEFSTQSIDSDISRSSWVLYRGSTAAISAAANGVTPIYLKCPNEFSIDPLYEISDLHPVVIDVDQFIAALTWSKWTKEAQDYCAEFYKTMDYAILMQAD